MTLNELISHLEGLFPRYLQEDYDNSGLQIGQANVAIQGVLVALDCTEVIVQEAIDKKCNVIVVHHPLLFKGIKRIGWASEIERIIHRCIKHDIAVYAIHTNIDNHISGVNGKIADILGLIQRRVLVPKKQTLYKLSVYTPIDHQQAVHDSLCRVGAGGIGEYRDCAFFTEGVGTFTPSKEANPTIGKADEPTEVAEVKMEYLIEKHRLAESLEAMRSKHPYEEVAHDLILLENTNGALGSGLVGILPEAIEAEKFLLELKNRFRCGVIKHTKLTGKMIKKVALCGGSGSFLTSEALRQNADIFISADFKYHDFFAAEGKIILADIGHYESEQYTSALLVEIIQEKFPTFAVRLTENNTNPINIL